jgi:hypothetical protein
MMSMRATHNAMALNQTPDLQLIVTGTGIIVKENAPSTHNKKFIQFFI